MSQNTTIDHYRPSVTTGLGGWGRKDTYESEDRLRVWCRKLGITNFGLYCPLRKFTHILIYEDQQNAIETKKCLCHCSSAKKAEAKPQSSSSPVLLRQALTGGSPRSFSKVKTTNSLLQCIKVSL